MKKFNEFLLEACIENIDQANEYAAKLIDRFELCSELDKSGLSPTLDLVNHCINILKIDSVIMLRLRDDFDFREEDIEIYKKQIQEYKSIGANTFIFGFIKNSKLDLTAMRIMIDLIGEDGKWCCHMASDLTNDFDLTLRELIELNFSWVLTKCGKTKAIDNIDNIRKYHMLYSSKIPLLIGGGVTKENFMSISTQTGVKWFHGKKIK